MKRLAAAHAAQNGTSFADAYSQLTQGGEQQASAGYQTDDSYGQQGVDEHDAKLDLRMVLAWDGNLAELIDEHELKEIGAQVVREYEIDAADDKDWNEGAKKALEAASQKTPTKKETPFPNAANVKYPLLTVAMMQFAARAYPAIVRGDEVIDVKPLGDDPHGLKAKRANRVSAFANDQLIYQCPEWEIGTDALLHALPAVGSAFRKVYWDVHLKRPRLEFVSALNVVMPAGVISTELSPRITHIIEKFPYEIEVLTRGDHPQWLECEYTKDVSDTQKQETFLEQCRYIDLDDDGLSEPYVVTVHKDTSKVVRIDAAFDAEDVKQDDKGNVVKIERTLPWIDYLFIPHPLGSAKGIGFGQLLASFSDVIDTTINQLIDAGTWANTNTGFLSSAVKLRGGEMSLSNNVFKTLPGAMNVKDAIYRMEFPGPSQTLFNLLEFLIATAKDITSVKDVLTGDAPGSQPATSTLALIEQGLQVFSAIYKRIYRSMTREFELLFKLNARYLDDADYQKFLDQQPPEQEVNQQQPAGIGHNNGPPMSPADMMGAAPPQQQQPQGMQDANGQTVDYPTGASSPLGQQAQAIDQTMQPGGGMPQMGMAPQMQQGMPPQGPPPGLQGALVQQMQGQRVASAAEDFNPEDMDVRPVADPTAVTEMQRLAKAQFLLQFKGDPTVNAVEINKRAFEAARLADIDKLIIESNPLMEIQAQAQAAAAQASAEAAKWDAAVKQATAQRQGALMQSEIDLNEAQAGKAKADAMQPAQVEQGPAPHEIELAQAQAENTRADTQAKLSKVSLDQHSAAMDEAERGMNMELAHHKNANDQQSSTLERLKVLGDQHLSKDQLDIELRKIVDDAHQRHADREAQAKQAEAQRRHESTQNDADRTVERQKMTAQKETAVAVAKARPKPTSTKP